MRRRWTGRVLRLVGSALLGALLLGGLPLGAVPAGADDIPEAARKDADEARALLAKGDAKSVEKAFSAVSRAKDKAPDSVDFWELFVRVWRAAKKSEGDLQKLLTAREQKNPTATTFDVLRARLESDPAKRVEHIRKAIEKDPTSVPARLLLVRALRAQGEETQAEDLLDKVLADAPDHEEALVAKAELMVEGGLSRSAVTFVEEALARKESPRLRYALALALQKVAQEDADALPKALEAAQKAVDGLPEPRAVGVLADLLDASGKTTEAVALLKQHVARTKDAALAARLGQLAMRAGDYDTAAPHLAQADPADLKAAKALALAYARRGRGKEAKAVAERVLAADPEAWSFGIEVGQLIGDTALARRAAGERKDHQARFARAAAFVWEAKPAELLAAEGEALAAGDRMSEDLCLLLLEARLVVKLGPKAAAYRKQQLDARTQVAGSVVPEAQASKGILDLECRSMGYMQRTMSYLLSACGKPYESFRIQPIGGAENGSVAIGFGYVAGSPCARDPQRQVRFNKQVAGEGGRIELKVPQDQEGWQKAEAALAEACAAVGKEDYPAAVAAFDKVLEAEPAWHRVQALRAMAASFLPGADLAALAKVGVEASQVIPDDVWIRASVLALAALAGTDIAAPLASLHRFLEERSARRPEDL